MHLIRSTRFLRRMIPARLLPLALLLAPFPARATPPFSVADHVFGPSSFNERGYERSAKVNPVTDREVIQPFNGNLSFTQRLFEIPLRDGFTLPITLTYNGSVNYRSRVAQRKIGAPTVTTSAPAWILGVGGYGAHTWNYETRLVCDWDGSPERSDPSELVFLVDGWDAEWSDWTSSRSLGEFRFLRQDGSTITMVAGFAFSPLPNSRERQGFKLLPANRGVYSKGWAPAMAGGSFTYLDEAYHRDLVIHEENGIITHFVEDVPVWTDLSRPRFSDGLDGERFPIAPVLNRIEFPTDETVYLEYDHPYFGRPILREINIPSVGVHYFVSVSENHTFTGIIESTCEFTFNGWGRPEPIEATRVERARWRFELDHDPERLPRYVITSIRNPEGEETLFSYGNYSARSASLGGSNSRICHKGRGFSIE
jgi:hypothetical protein